ncbi:amidohydrolase family protein [Flavobacterium rivuli]|uniref:amidohydrolase family protein n=1 Tax=Flavobacterium rivuli TaxID=498301 RepID=UPI00036DD01B|nr:amidohydrolase family protein [Flavobacterium rivuli]
MIIDSHVHFWNFDPLRDTWITEDMKVISRDFLPGDVEPIFKENAVSGCIAVQADQSASETQFLLKLAGQNPFIKGVVGWIDLKNLHIEDELINYSAYKKLKGFRHISEGEGTGFLVQEDIINGLKALQKYNYTYDILIKQHQLKEAITLTETLPEMTFILDHCAKPDLKQDDCTSWKSHIKIISQNPNVYCKLSGLLTQCDWNNWNEKEIFNCLDVVFENFGSSRILFGSDWPVMLLAGNYSQWLDLIKKYTNQFTQIDKENIFCKNAEHFYKL